MTLIPLMDCCDLLAIDPKTLRTYLKRAAMELSPHPTDARIKCLTLSQVQSLAVVHGRPLQPLGTSPRAQPEGTSPLVQPEPASSLASLEASEVLRKLSLLETRVATLSEHLAQLALALLQERDRNLERRITALETSLQERLGNAVSPPSLPAPLAPCSEQVQPDVGAHQRRLHPAEQQARSRMPPLIEYSKQGVYVMVSSQEGELHLQPDSPAWFDWLATLSSFRFIGQQGRFSAYRKSSTSRSWSAYRTIHQHDYRHYLGTTDHLTIDCFERVAATLQSYMPSL